MRTVLREIQTKKPPLSGTSVPSKATKDKIDYLFAKVLKDDDYKAFEQLFHVGYSPLRSFCKKLVHVNEVAEELVSEVFFKIWNNRKAIVISSSPRSYLYTAVRNISFDHLRKEKRCILTNLDDAVTVPSDYFDPQKRSEFEELQVKIEVAVARLPKQCRLVFQLSRDHGLRYNEIAEKLHLSVKTIETQMGRALKSLRKSLASPN
jgi:RNA polymerase sigma-70 factor (ECF subfamily)